MNEKSDSNHYQLARDLADRFAVLPQVEAVALGGSRGSGPGATDHASDIDLYVYTRGEIPLAVREQMVADTGGATQKNLALDYWGAGDEWLNAPTGIEADICYFDAQWMQTQIARVLDDYQPALGYTTCFCYTMRQSIVFHDPRGWFHALQEKCRGEYPEPLRQNIIRHNHPVLRGIIPSYATQLGKAVKRTDLVSINHRVAALLASYFDILFAFNRQLHPGEKRQLEFAAKHCPQLPFNLDQDLQAILLMTAAEIPALPQRVNLLLDHLDELLASFLSSPAASPTKTRP